MGSLMIAGGIHMLIGLTGLVGVLLRFIGPITVVPALTIVCYSRHGTHGHTRIDTPLTDTRHDTETHEHTA